MLLKLNRPIANTGDRVRAELLMAAGYSPQPIKIAAWLTRTTGSELSLPTLEPGLHFAYEGASSNGRLTLLDRSLAALGSGDYQVQVRAYNSNTGQLSRLAAAGFSVCDTPATVAGSVHAASGQLLGGGNPSLALVTAYDVDDGAVTASAAIAASGAYSLPLLPGRYLLAAKVLDSAGFHTAEGQELVAVGCQGLGATYNLTATVPLAVPGASAGLGVERPRPAPLSAQAGPASTIPPPAALVGYESAGVASNMGDLLFDYFLTHLMNCPRPSGRVGDAEYD